MVWKLGTHGSTKATEQLHTTIAVKKMNDVLCFVAEVADQHVTIDTRHHVYTNICVGAENPSTSFRLMICFANKSIKISI